MIKLSHVSKSFGKPAHNVLTDISLTIDNGEFVSLSGRSGSGKSTLLYVMSSLDEPTQGQVIIDGKDIYQLDSKSIHDFRNRYMGFVFQFHYLLPELTALENIMMPAKKLGHEQQVLQYAKHLLEEFEIQDKANSLPRELSGGQCQRVAIARALIMQPKYLFADEPTGSLDSQSGEKVMAIISNANRQFGTTVIYVTHDQEFAARAPKMITLVDGRASTNIHTLQR